MTSSSLVLSTHRVPLATYRIQFNRDFTFRDAIGILDYLRDLGITHVYASPAFTSRRGSNHGYDVTDPLKIDPDLGGEEAFEALQRAIDEHGMGLLLDIVPNHMAASSENRWWMDVLEYGPDSPFASYFDINWRSPSRIMQGRLLLPFLDRPFGEALDAGLLRIHWEDGRFVLRYGEQLFPIAPASYAEILSHRAEDLPVAALADSPAAEEWQGIVAAARALATEQAVGSQAAAERRARFDQLRERLRQLTASSPEFAAFLDAILRAINGTPGDARSFRDLERLLFTQHYRLAFWQTATDSINYRRFFSITDLVGVRVEDPSVFDATHEAIIRVGQRAGITGFRIDHIDGLRDPRGYLARLRERLTQNGSAHEEPYIVVEKIPERSEWLPADWPIEGTTGYDYLNFANRVMVDSKSAPAIRDFYDRWTGTQTDFDDLCYQKKKLVMRTLLGVEMRSLGRDLAEIASSDRYAREFSPTDLTEALVEVTACLSVYRTYIQTLDLPEAEVALLTDAIAAARVRRPALDATSFDFLSDVLLLAPRDHVRADQREARLAFVGRWQQFTGSIMAKGFEDTALYIYFPLAALNEVGGDPRCSNIDPLAFHPFIQSRAEKWSFSMNTTTTHDTKRSEDARARIAVLSEIPDEWERCVMEWSRMNEAFVAKSEGARSPDKNEEYLFYQTLLGTWPLTDEDWPPLVQRVQEYMIKAIREAKIHTRWTHPNEPHEAALRDFVARVLDREQNPAFHSGFSAFADRVGPYGMLNGLAQVLLKVAAPGVPDCYQGADLWDFRLVDPDNRGAVDFAARSALLSGLRSALNRDCACYAQELLQNWPDGRVKLHVFERALAARAKSPDVFLEGEYIPLTAEGDHRGRVLAFARRHGEKWAIAAMPRCVAAVHAPVVDKNRTAFWEKTSLRWPSGTPGRWLNLLAGARSAPVIRTDETLSLGDVFRHFPLSLLVPQPE